MKRLLLSALLMATVTGTPALPAYADDGGGYRLPSVPSLWDGYAVAEQTCTTSRGEYSPGKTVTGFEATASDGCTTRSWSGSIGQGPGSGTVTFTTTNKVNPWEGDLPSMAGGPEAYCRARAAHEANLYWILTLHRPGVQVTVEYACD